MKLFLFVSQVAVLLQTATATSTGCSGALNNIQRCFLSSSTSASTFCSAYLSIPVVTVTFTPSAFTTVPSIASTTTQVITSTVTSTAYSTVVATATSSLFSTSSNVVTSTVTSTVYSTGVATTVVTTFTTTITTAPAGLQKRATSSQFKCITSNSVGPVLYSATVISSACRCLSVSTKTVTATTATLTKTSYSRVTQSTATTSTLQVPTTVPTTTTTTVIQTVVVTSYITSTLQAPTTVITSTIQTNTETDVITSVTTSAPSGPPTCDTSIQHGGKIYANGYGATQFFYGSGVSENLNNPSDYDTPIITIIPGTVGCNDALVQCYGIGTSQNGYDGPYFGLDLHYMLLEGYWVCVNYPGFYSTASDFNVVNPDIGVAIGYQADF